MSLLNAIQVGMYCTNLSESCFHWNHGVVQGNHGTSPKVPPKTRPLHHQILKRSRAPTISMTSSMYETDGSLVGDSEKTTAEEGSPRIENLHLPRHPIGHFSLLSFRIRFFHVRTLCPIPFLVLLHLFVAPRRPVGLLIYLAIYIHVILHRDHDGDY